MVKNKDTQNQSTDSHRTPKRGTRICTHADIVRMKMWISSNMFENAFIDFQRSSRVDEPSAKKGGTRVTDINPYKLRYIGPVKSAGAADVLHPNFGAHREPHDTSIKEHDVECTEEIVEELRDNKDE